MHSQRPGTPTQNPEASPKPSGSRALAAVRRYGLPIALGYFPAAAAYGLLARQGGLSIAETLFLSIWVFAGASQFLMVGMVAAGLAWPVWFLTGAFINLRHVLFAVAMAPRWTGWSLAERAVASFGLTDEVYAVVASDEGGFRRLPEVVGLEATAYLSWVGGSLVGAWGSVALPPAWTEPLEFALPALFLALLLPSLRAWPGVAAALVGGGVSLGAAAAGQGSWGIVLGGILGAMAGGLVARTSEGPGRWRAQEGASRGQ